MYTDKFFKLSMVLSFLFLAALANAQNTEELKVYPVLWQQQAAEYRALCYQAFNIASLRLHEIPKKEFRRNKLAIITDLDETILDNSYQEVELIKTNQTYNNRSWKEWSNKSAATSVPGAADFLREASSKGVTIFYISNRDTSEVQATLLNLKKLNLPNTDTAHMLFLSSGPSKESRRQIVMSTYTVVMLLGDNLNDFTQAFEGEMVLPRKAETDNSRADWGKRFIVLPNPVYGEWENAIYDYQKNLTPAQKQQKRSEKLIGYDAMQ